MAAAAAAARLSVSPAVEGTCREDNEEDEDDGGDKGDAHRAPHVAAEVVVDAAYLVPPHVGVALQADVRHAAAGAGGRRQHARHGLHIHPVQHRVRPPPDSNGVPEGSGG